MIPHEIVIRVLINGKKNNTNQTNLKKYCQYEQQ